MRPRTERDGDDDKGSESMTFAMPRRHARLLRELAETELGADNRWAALVRTCVRELLERRGRLERRQQLLRWEQSTGVACPPIGALTTVGVSVKVPAPSRRRPLERSSDVTPGPRALARRLNGRMGTR